MDHCCSLEGSNENSHIVCDFKQCDVTLPVILLQKSVRYYLPKTGTVGGLL
jgi:hypothetical protein